jgi:hypothetical protein
MKIDDIKITPAPNLMLSVRIASENTKVEMIIAE